MTSRELVLGTLERKFSDRPVPWVEIETRDELVASSLKLDELDDLTWADRVGYAKLVGMDAIGFAHWERFGCEVVKKGLVLGFIPKIKTRADLSHFAMPSKIDFDRLRERVCRAKEAIGDTGIALFVAHLFCLDPVIMDMGLTHFSIALYEERDLLHDLFRRYTDYYSALDQFYSSLPEIDFIWVGEDIAYNTGTIISPDLLREMVFPYFQEIASNIKKPWIYHSDGDVTAVIPDLLKLGMDGLHPLEPAVMDIQKVKKMYGDKVTLIGNVDINTLTSGTEDDVKQEVWSLMDSCAPGGGYMLSSGNSLTNYVNPENVRAMGEAKDEWNTRNRPPEKS
jgi:hypothetical protein